MEGAPKEKSVCPPIHVVLKEICSRVEGIERLEKKITEVADNFTGELGQIREKLANLTVERRKDSGEIENLQGSVKYFTFGLQSTNETQENFRMRIDELENTNYKLLERIEVLEQRNEKLSEDMKLYEERQKRRNMGARPKVLVPVDTDLKEKLSKEAEESKKSKALYSAKIINGTDMVKELKTAKEVDLMEKGYEMEEKDNDGKQKSKEMECVEDEKKNDLSKGKEETKDIEHKKGEQNLSLDLDLMAEARRCIGISPVKACQILKHHNGNYEIGAEDIPQHHNLRDRAAKEFLKGELNWENDAKIETKWSSERNILWLTFQDEELVTSIFKKQAEIKNDNIKLLKLIPWWCYERNRQLETLCRIERDKDKDLRTKVLLGKDDLILGIKKKGENLYNWVSVEHFGAIPGFNFFKKESQESPIREDGIGSDGEGRSRVVKRPLPPIYWSGEMKQSIEDRKNVPREGYNSEKGSLESEWSYESLLLDTEQRKEEDYQDECKEGSYLLLSSILLQNSH